MKRNESDFDTEMDKLSREEILKLLKELSLENDSLIKRSEMLTDQLTEIIEKVRATEELNSNLENENDQILKRYNKLVKKYNELDKKVYICHYCMGQNSQNQEPTIAQP